MARKKISIKGFLAGAKKAIKTVAKVAGKVVASPIFKTALSLTPLGAGINLIAKTPTIAKGLALAIKAGKAVKNLKPAEKTASIVQKLTDVGLEPTPSRIDQVLKAVDSNKPVKVYNQETIMREAVKKAEDEGDKLKAEKNNNKFYSLFDDDDINDEEVEERISLLEDRALSFKEERTIFNRDMSNTKKNIEIFKKKLQQNLTSGIFKAKKNETLYNELKAKAQDLKIAVDNIDKEIKQAKNLKDDPSPYIVLAPETSIVILKMYKKRVSEIDKSIKKLDARLNAYIEKPFEDVVKAEKRERAYRRKTTAKETEAERQIRTKQIVTEGKVKIAEQRKGIFQNLTGIALPVGLVVAYAIYSQRRKRS